MNMAFSKVHIGSNTHTENGKLIGVLGYILHIQGVTLSHLFSCNFFGAGTIWSPIYLWIYACLSLNNSPYLLAIKLNKDATGCFLSSINIALTDSTIFVVITSYLLLGKCALSTSQNKYHAQGQGLQRGIYSWILKNDYQTPPKKKVLAHYSNDKGNLHNDDLHG